MTGFTPSERLQADQQIKLLARGLHDLSPDLVGRLHRLLREAERNAPDATLARLLVAESLMRGIQSKARGPVRTGCDAMTPSLAAVLDQAAQLGAALQPHVLAPPSGLSRLFRRPPARLPGAAQRALLLCKTILVAAQRRSATGTTHNDDTMLRTA